MSTIINNNAITKMYKGDTPIYSFSINSGGDINLTNIDITTNGTYTAPDGEGYKTINVDVPTGGGSGKIDIAATGIKLGNSTFTEIPDIIDFSNVTDMSGMFGGCQNITTITPIDTSNVTNMGNMFKDCSKLQSIPLLNTSNVISMSGLFYYCSSLQSIPPIDTAKVTDVGNMFSDCISLQSLPLLDFGNVKHSFYFFGFSTLNKLTDLGGFKNMKASINSYFLDKAPNLTIESLMNVINNVYDLTANGLSGQSLKFGSTNLNKLTAEQVAVATAKGWTLTA